MPNQEFEEEKHNDSWNENNLFKRKDGSEEVTISAGSSVKQPSSPNSNTYTKRAGDDSNSFGRLLPQNFVPNLGGTPSNNTSHSLGLSATTTPIPMNPTPIGIMGVLTDAAFRYDFTVFEIGLSTVPHSATSNANVFRISSNIGKVVYFLFINGFDQTPYITGSRLSLGTLNEALIRVDLASSIQQAQRYGLVASITICAPLINNLIDPRINILYDAMRDNYRYINPKVLTYPTKIAQDPKAVSFDFLASKAPRDVVAQLRYPFVPPPVPSPTVT